MTDRRLPQPPRAPRPVGPAPPARRSGAADAKRQTARRVFATTALMFAVVVGVLGVRMAQGQDPALGTGPAKTAVAAVPQKRPVIVRKVIVTRYITVIAHDRPEGAPASSAPSGTAPAGTSTPQRVAAPVQQTSAPAPAPAAQPAPVQTKTS